MTEKELRELKRRFRPERSNIPRIVGCFVNSNKQIISRISQPLGLSDSVVNEMLLSAMKKVLSGSLGTNLNEIAFSTKQVSDSEEHKLLMSLRSSSLKDTEVLERFYDKVISSLDFDGNYVILLANDVYDVTKRYSDGESGESTEQFSYIVCAVCPLKEPPEALTFREADSLFHSASSSSLLSPAELGFTFPAFDDRSANIYGALYYTRSLSEGYPAFTETIFGKESPMPPRAQKEAFSQDLSRALSEECSFEVVRSLHAQVAELVEEHKQSRDPEPLTITKATVKSILGGCGVAEEKIDKVAEAFDDSFGKNAAIAPKNIISSNKFEVKMPEVSVKVTPDSAKFLSTQTIGDEKYLMIKLTGAVEVNGILISSDDKS